MAIYWGAYVDYSGSGGSSYFGQTISGSPFDTFEGHAGKKASIVHFAAHVLSNSVNQSFPSSSMTNVWSTGRVPMLNLGTWDLQHHANDIKLSMHAIANGGSNFMPDGTTTIDSYFTTWFTAAKNWKHPFFFRLWQEFNFSAQTNPQFPWAIATFSNWQGTGTSWTNSLADWIAAWQHLHDICMSVGATNVTWVWNPNIKVPDNSHTTAGTGYYAYSELYPGDQYVDWLALDGYNKTRQQSAYDSLKDIYLGNVGGLANSYSEITALSNKPLMIAEVGTDDRQPLSNTVDATAKASWFTSALGTDLKTSLPRVQAFVYSELDYSAPGWTSGTVDNADHWVIVQSGTGGATPDPTFTPAFAAGIASPYFAEGTKFIMPADMQPIPQFDALPQQSKFRTAASHTRANNLILWTKLNESSGTTATDSSSAGHNGTYSGTVTFGKLKLLPGVLDPGVGFDGSTGKVVFADHNDFSIGTTGKLSFLIPFRISATPAGTTHLVSKGNVSNYEYSIFINATGWGVTVYTSTGSTYEGVSVTQTISLNTWHVLIVTIDNSLSTAQVVASLDNGTLHSSGTPSGTIANGTAALQFAKRADNSNNAYGGDLQDVMMWNTILTQQDKDELWADAQKRRRSPQRGG